MVRDSNLGDSSPGEVYLYHDWGRDDSVTATILEGVAAVTDRPLTDLDPPLFEVVNPDALDTLCQPLTDGELRDGNGRLTLPIYDCTVTLHWDGTVAIDPPDES